MHCECRSAQAQQRSVTLVGGEFRILTRDAATAPGPRWLVTTGGAMVAGAGGGSNGSAVAAAGAASSSAGRLVLASCCSRARAPGFSSLKTRYSTLCIQRFMCFKLSSSLCSNDAMRGRCVINLLPNICKRYENSTFEASMPTNKCKRTVFESEISVARHNQMAYAQSSDS